MTDNTYNGWTNYETWRVNLEWFDGMTLANMGVEVDDDTEGHEVAEYLKDYIEMHLDGQESTDNLFKGYVIVFLQSVNWLEIAEHMIDNSKE